MNPEQAVGVENGLARVLGANFTGSIGLGRCNFLRYFTPPTALLTDFTS
jgi:hypothetical protein